MVKWLSERGALRAAGGYLKVRRLLPAELCDSGRSLTSCDERAICHKSNIIFLKLLESLRRLIFTANCPGRCESQEVERQELFLRALVSFPGRIILLSRRSKIDGQPRSFRNSQSVVTHRASSKALRAPVVVKTSIHGAGIGRGRLWAA